MLSFQVQKTSKHAIGLTTDYKPYLLQIVNPMATSLLMPSNGNYHLAVKGTFYSREKNRKRNKQKTNTYIKHNKTLCNLNVYYLPPLSNILQV